MGGRPYLAFVSAVVSITHIQSASGWRLSYSSEGTPLGMSEEYSPLAAALAIASASSLSGFPSWECTWMKETGMLFASKVCTTPLVALATTVMLGPAEYMPSAGLPADVES